MCARQRNEEKKNQLYLRQLYDVLEETGYLFFYQNAGSYYLAEKVQDRLEASLCPDFFQVLVKCGESSVDDTVAYRFQSKTYASGVKKCYKTIRAKIQQRGEALLSLQEAQLAQLLWVSCCVNQPQMRQCIQRGKLIGTLKEPTQKQRETYFLSLQTLLNKELFPKIREIYPDLLNAEELSGIPVVRLLNIFVFLALSDEADTENWGQLRHLLRGYLFGENSAEPVRSEAGPLLRTLEANDIFDRPKRCYIEPAAWMHQLQVNAYQDGRIVHVISGERGLGKTSLARAFAQKCAEGQFGPALAFRRVVYTTYKQNLEKTIAFLEVSGETEKSFEEKVQQRLQLLRTLEKPALLVIDNLDSGSAELAEDAACYRALRNTGCHILITSKVDMRGCAYLEQTQIDRLSIEELERLFLQLTTDVPDRKQLRVLIEKYLHCNTYLVRLAARLLETRDIEEIVDAFSCLNTEQIEDPIDGKGSEENSFYEHFKRMFDLSCFADDRESWRLLYNLVLLPLDGMSYREFFDRAFAGEDRKQMQIVFKRLQESFWVELSHKRITVHPLIRELIAKQSAQFIYDFIERYVDSIDRTLDFASYEPGIVDAINRGEAIWEVIAHQKYAPYPVGCLLANLTSNYDILGNHELAYETGVMAFEVLQCTEQAALDRDGLQRFAEAYNKLGYAIVHLYRDAALEYAEKALYRAKDLIACIRNGDDGVERLCSYNLGNIAAYHIARKEYQKAFAIHSENLALRKRFPSCQTTDVMIAASYKGMATAMFYQAVKAGKTELVVENPEKLRRAFEYHANAVRSYEAAYSPEYHFDILVADNRRVSTLIHLLPYLPEEEKRGCVSEAVEGMLRAIAYLDAVGTADPRERTISRNNLRKLYAVASFDAEMQRKLAQILAEMGISGGTD